MQIAIVHYHLNRGGVTQVILNHLRSLDSALESQGSGPLQVAILYGGRRDGWPDPLAAELKNVRLQLCEVPSLEYDTSGESEIDPAGLAVTLRETLREIGFTAEQTVLHLHNHALGKNRALPGALIDLAADGYSMLMQIHDFSEDFRPETYRHLQSTLLADDPASLADRLYPQADSIHYAVLNRRDRSVLDEAGVATARVHFLPNPVGDFEALPSHEAARQKLTEQFSIPPEATFVLYPVRGIRRKNLGELLLWSALAGEGFAFASTLSPLNPLEQPSHEFWQAVAAKLGLGCWFGIGDPGGLPFLENIAAADAMITTSVAEGFGMVFLEAWLAGRRLIGRDLPEITADFVEAGLSLEHLHSGLRIPLPWIGSDSFRESQRTRFMKTAAEYGQVPDEDSFDEDLQSLIQDDLIDFAQLDREQQAAVIEKVQQEAASREALFEKNPWLREALASIMQGETNDIERNAAVVREHYSFDVSGKRLLEVYCSVVASPRGGAITGPVQGASILKSFLNIRRFHPVRVQA